MALSLAITQWCIELGRGISTGEGKKPAYKAMWDHRCACFSILLVASKIRGCSDAEGRYRDEWRWDEATQEAYGNPASAPIVVDLVKSLKHKYGAGGASQRTHSVAMTEQHMATVHQHYLAMCPGQKMPCVTLHEKDQRMRFLFYMAFATLSFTLWTRCVAQFCLFCT